MEALYQEIFKRKSFRRFDDSLKILPDELEQIHAFLNQSVQSLGAQIPIAYQVVLRDFTTCKRGEYCILIYSEHNSKGLLNVGYCFQQLDLFLASLNIGACWYGMGKTDFVDVEACLPFTIMIAIGKATPQMFRKDYRKAKRKDNTEIWRGDAIKDMCSCIKYAPSTCNSQPWLIENHEGELQIYMRCKEKMLVPKERRTFYNMIDIGILMCFSELWFQENYVDFERIIYKKDLVSCNGELLVSYFLT